MSKIQIRFFVSCYAYPMYRYLITKYVFLYPKLPCLQGFNTMNFFNKSAGDLDFWPWKKVSGLAIDMHNHFTSKTISISLSKVCRYTNVTNHTRLFEQYVIQVVLSQDRLLFRQWSISIPMCSYTKYENLIHSLIWQVLILKSPLSRQLGVQKPMLSGLTVALAT